MPLTVYGTSRSRAFRVLWMLEEIGLPYEHDPIGWNRCGTDAAYLAINPAGTIPCIVDGGCVLAESLAINLHLAREHGALTPAVPHGDALALQWSLWAATALETPHTGWATHARWTPAQARDEAQIAAAAQSLQKPLARLALALDGRRWLVGDAFSVADLNVAAVMPQLRDFEPCRRPAVTDWLERCCGRDAYVRAAARS